MDDEGAIDTLPAAPRLPPLGGWPRAISLRVLALLIAGIALYRTREGLGAVVVLFILVVPFERLFPRHDHQRFRRPHLDLDVGYAFASPLLQSVGLFAAIIIGVLSFTWIPGLLLRPYIQAIPDPYLLFVGVALFDLAGYWTHRWYHEVPQLWRFHAVHHSPEHMDWISGFRAHPFDGTLIAPAFFFLIAAGFTAETAGLIAIVQVVLGLFLHANVNLRLRPLSRIIMTPEFHHWHHSSEEEAIWCNYSTFLPLWDILFGTYYMPKGKRPTTYGVDELMPMTMVEQLRYPLVGMGNPWRFVRHPWRSFKGMLRGLKVILGMMKRSMFRPRKEPFERAVIRVQQPQLQSEEHQVL
ncbi:MAG: sterol desaturase family protein [Candidatus Poseidonia sp.]|nr:sterol desaturase family protein [Poseidonia sp.]